MRSIAPSNTSPSRVSGTSSKALPGDLAIWIFILAELGVFSIFFVCFAVVRVLNLELFAEGASHLNQAAGICNTIALITSSYFVVLAVDSVKHDRAARASRYFSLAFLTACVYVVIKVWEYVEAYSAGYSLHTDVFFMFYFLLTFFHFAHVLFGMVILGYMARKASMGVYSSSNCSGVMSGASYWHMVDLLWIILFPLVYVIH